jgi:hypothetical protein
MSKGRSLPPAQSCVMSFGVETLTDDMWNLYCDVSLSNVQCLIMPMSNVTSQSQLICKYGYPSESHTIQTDDGYLLTLHRIPHGRKSAYNTSRIPVFLQHGLLGSSASWVINGPNKSLRKCQHHVTGFGIKWLSHPGVYYEVTENRENYTRNSIT